MIRGLIIVKTEHVEEARALAQQPPFLVDSESAAAFLVPANPVYAGMTITTPATLYWASGEFDPGFWNSIIQASAAFDWGGAWEYDIDNDTSFPQAKLAEILSLNTNGSWQIAKSL